ncbi:mediator of RNA polymerase II transcription subunit 25-like isoform X2 [Rutidosis leptorrhynchoides]
MVLVIEGTAALRPYWPTILHDHLNDLIRSYYEEEEDAEYNVEFACVVFNTTCESSSSIWMLHQSKWTNDLNYLMKSLSAIDFSSDTDAATAQGLAQALTMFRSSNESQSQNESLVERHCILVAASNIDPPTPDVKKVANLFPQSNVSLSVLYPWKLPNLGAICKACKHINPSIVAGVETVVTDNTSLNAKPNIRRTLADVNYVKEWEGDLCGVIQGKHLLLARLHAYLHSSASKLVKDWPSSIEIDLYSWTNKIESLQKKYAETSCFVLFRAIDSHEVLGKLQKHKHFGVIKLPSQIVVLTVTDDPSRFIGMILTKQTIIKYKTWK